MKTFKKNTPVSQTVIFHLITLFPGAFSSYLGESILARAQKEGRLSVKFYDPRDFVKPTGLQRGKDKPYLRVDDKPYGGGPGMVMQALPVIKAVEKAMGAANKKAPKGTARKTLIVFLSPSGKQFTNALARAYAAYTDVIIICGRYEGIDERVKKIFKTADVSVGPFVTTGGELPAMIMMDSIARQIPGVLGNFDSREEERVSSSVTYTRPEVLEYKGKKYLVPKVLLSGDHKRIEEWRAGKKGVK